MRFVINPSKILMFLTYQFISFIELEYLDKNKVYSQTLKIGRLTSLKQFKSSFVQLIKYSKKGFLIFENVKTVELVFLKFI